MRPTTRRGGADPVLASLRAADCTVSRAGRVVGPAGIRTSLQDARGPMELDEDEILAALDQLGAVQRIADAECRRVLAAAIDTRGCRRVATVREIAAATGLPVARVHRKLRQAINAIAYDFARMAA